MEVPVDGFSVGQIPTGESPFVLDASNENGGQARVEVPGGALPAGSNVSVGPINDLDALTDQAPPPDGADVTVAFVLQATDEDGNPIEDDFAAPVDVTFTLPADDVPPGAGSGSLVVTFWNGDRWVEVEATATTNPDGSVTFEGSVDHFTIFAVAHMPGYGRFGASSDSGAALTTWGGGGYARLDEALGAAGLVAVVEQGRFILYSPGRPPWLNERFVAVRPDGVRRGEIVFVKW